MKEKLRRRSDRIRWAITKRGRGYKAVSEKMNKSLPTVYGWCTREGVLKNLDLIVELGEVTQTSWIWIANGFGSPDHVWLAPSEEEVIIRETLEKMTLEEKHHMYHFFLAYREARKENAI